VTAGPSAQRQFSWGDLTAPATYNNNSWNTPATYNTTPQSGLNNIPPGQVISYSGANYYHVVQPGEYLYSIARSHGLNEAQIRKYNGFPTVGIVSLYPGDQLWLVDPNEAYKNGQQLPPSSDRPQQYNNNNTTPPSGTKSGTFIESPTDGVYIRNDQNNPEPQRFAPRNDNNTAPYIEPLSPQQYGYNPNPNNAVGQTPTHFNEHIVKYGETIGSIAQLYRMSVNQLATYNEKTEKEALIPGQKILIPRY
jgi:LysM repeat protein